MFLIKQRAFWWNESKYFNNKNLAMFPVYCKYALIILLVNIVYWDSIAYSDDANEFEL